MKLHFLGLALATLFAVLPMSLFAQEASSPPNIVVILSDDFGYGSTNSYGASESLIKTPNIDRLAQEGKRFTHAYTASSVCSPTRYALLTGRYAFRTSLKRGVLNPFSPLHISQDQLNIAALAKKHGYTTAAIGKWHLGYGDGKSGDGRTDYQAKLSPGPLEIGFDYHFGVPSNHGDLTGVFVENHFVYGLRNGKDLNKDEIGSPAADDSNFQESYPSQETESQRVTTLDIDAPRRKNTRVMPVLTDKAVAWIEKQSGNKPFLLYYTPVAIHNPVTPDAAQAGTSAAGVYGDWIHELDASVGEVLKALDRKGFAENTIVLFTSDNGGVFRPNNKQIPQTAAFEAGLKVNGELRGGKHTVFEGGFRVPYLVRWPGKIKPGTVNHSVVGLIDTLATLAVIFGETLPKPNQAAQDSFSALPAWVGEDATVETRPHIIVHSADGVFAIRKGPWKWIEGIPEGTTSQDANNRNDNFKSQLFHLEQDPSESTDVSESHPEIVAELKTLLNRYRLGGYSRELPSDEEVQVATLAAQAAKASTITPVESIAAWPDPLIAIPTSPWSVVRGDWKVHDGGLFVTSAPRQTAAISTPALTKPDVVIEYEVFLDGAQRQAVRFDLEGNRSFRFDVAPSGISIVKNDSDGAGPDKQENWAELSEPLAEKKWHTVTITLQAEKATISIGPLKTETNQAWIKDNKQAISFVVANGSTGIRKVSIK
jgi:arylsulfatase A